MHKPYYDQNDSIWRVDFPDRASEEGSLLCVSCEFLRTSLYYPFNDSQTKGKAYPGHGHSFEDVLRAVLHDPDGFDISGFESYYSQQEAELPGMMKQKLLERENRE